MIVLILKDFDKNIDILELWINYYTKQNIPFLIYIEKNIENTEINIDTKYITQDVSIFKNENILILTEYDFLFSYTKNENDVMILSTNITNIFEEKSIIGKVFYVPVLNKKKYTTFEIPDFILYKHENHTNYTLDGICINGGEKISESFVCLSLKTSLVAMNTEYYNNDILFDNKVCNIVYTEFVFNIYVNKEKKYAIIWHPKCACTNIIGYFFEFNEIKGKIPHGLVGDNNVYRYNNYLQGFDIVSFVRHPFFRFISCYFNKHFGKEDIYLKLNNYEHYLKKYNNKDTLYNFADYLQKGNIIDHHSLPITEMMYFKKYPKLNYNIYHIENNLNEYLYTFFSKYHKQDNNMKFEHIKNITVKNNNNNNKINENYKYYDFIDWRKYININNGIPDYLYIIDDYLNITLTKIYKNDLIFFKYKNLHIEENILKVNLPEEFDILRYKELNEDLIFFKYKNLHIEKNIIEENIIEKNILKVILPEDFDLLRYKELNEDFNVFNKDISKKHYIEHGIYENRDYKNIYFNIHFDFS